MIAFLALAAGIRAFLRVPRVFLTVWLLTLGVALPLALVLWRALAAVIPGTALADTGGRVFARDAWPSQPPADGLLSTFTPDVVGLAGPLGTLDALTTGRVPAPWVLAAVVAYAAVWVLLWGGVLDALARAHTGRSAFVAASRRAAGRVGRLALAVAAAYVAIAGLARLMGLPGGAAEGAPSVGALVAQGVIALAIGVVGIVADYARVYLVVRDQRRVRDALAAACRFVGRHPVPVAVVATAGLALFGAVLAGYAAFELVTRGVPRAWSAIVVGQAYVAARLAVRLVTVAAQVHLVQRLEPSV